MLLWPQIFQNCGVLNGRDVGENLQGGKNLIQKFYCLEQKKVKSAVNTCSTIIHLKSTVKHVAVFVLSPIQICQHIFQHSHYSASAPHHSALMLLHNHHAIFPPKEIDIMIYKIQSIFKFPQLSQNVIHRVCLFCFARI